MSRNNTLEYLATLYTSEKQELNQSPLKSDVIAKDAGMYGADESAPQNLSQTHNSLPTLAELKPVPETRERRVYSELDNLVLNYIQDPSKQNSGIVYQALEPTIKVLTRKMSYNLPHVLSDELVSLASVAFVHSLDRYDPNKGCFRNYFLQRAKGTIYDYLRSMDMVPVRVRNISKKWRAYSTSYVASEGKEADEEVMKKFCDLHGISLKKLVTVIDQTNHVATVCSIEDKVSSSMYGTEQIAISDMLKDTQPLPGEVLLDEESKLEVHRDLANLPPRQRYIATEYMSGTPLKTIAKNLQISSTRVIQIMQAMGQNNFSDAKLKHGFMPIMKRKL